MDVRHQRPDGDIDKVTMLSDEIINNLSIITGQESAQIHAIYCILVGGRLPKNQLSMAVAKCCEGCILRMFHFHFDGLGYGKYYNTWRSHERSLASQPPKRLSMLSVTIYGIRNVFANSIDAALARKHARI